MKNKKRYCTKICFKDLFRCFKRISFYCYKYSFLYLKILVKPELSMHGPMEHQNISFVS